MERKFKLVLELQKKFKNFYLAGGTAIMFKFKHRISFDIDLFSYKEFSFNRLSKKIRNFYNIEKEIRGIDNIDFYIDGTKVSFVFFPFKNIKRLENWNGIKKASDYDIFLNKIYVAGRRIDSKDPFDIGFLYKEYKNKWDFNRIKKDFEKKFPEQNFEIFLGAVLNFEDYPDLPEWVKNELKELEKRIID